MINFSHKEAGSFFYADGMFYHFFFKEVSLTVAGLVYAKISWLTGKMINFLNDQPL